MENYLGEIRIFPYNRIPSGWVSCDGQTLQINQNTALYSLLGIAFGGDVRTTFMLPNLNGRTVIGSGVNPVSGTVYKNGNSGGAESVTLSVATMPAHNHVALARSTYDIALPGTNFLGNPNVPTSSTQPRKNLYSSNLYNPGTGTKTPLNNQSVTIVGGNQPHENRMPYLAMVYCISIKDAIYPPHS